MKKVKPLEMEKGAMFPFGATFSGTGINFAVYIKDAEKVLLCLFHENNLDSPYEKFALHETGNIWHGYVKNLVPTVVYGYEVTNKQSTQLVVDPYAKSIASGSKWQDVSRKDFSYKPLGKVVENNFDWEGDESPHIPKKDLIIYEMHVRGFTRHASSCVKHPGTFHGIMEKIPYLKELGINAIELMPIQEFCEEDVIQENPHTHTKLHNYFGYSTFNFFSLMNRFAKESIDNKGVNEFKTLVKELHKNGIEVILDVVFNHTLEGNEQGPQLSFKVLDESAYYILNDQKQHMNFSGCGNTFNCNHPIAMELIIDVLRHWVLEYHVDGFRFDLAAIFNRGQDGAPVECPPILDFISKDPVLSSTKLIAEPWDAGGLYSLGQFASYGARWSDWNGKYQQSVRNFIKGSPHQKGLFASALTGSAELFPNSPYGSINYIAAHDGFTLADLVSYNEKHNEANGENNQDGTNSNESWNCGFEGDTDNKYILNLRQRQMRNFHLALMLSQGIPMLLMGDEYGHTRYGNNNPWCQDNEINWFLWDVLKKNKDFYQYYRFLINFRKSHSLLHAENRWGEKEIKWHGLNSEQPEWENDNRLIAFTLHSPDGEMNLYAAFNSSHQHHHLLIPNPMEGKKWKWVVNTKNPPLEEFFESNRRSVLEKNTYIIAPYSSILLQIC